LADLPTTEQGSVLLPGEHSQAFGVGTPST
jgi:hypothetical protein